MPGVAVGLAWTYVGGDILFIEAQASEGKGELKLTGNLGNVMKESASTAYTWVQANAKKIGIDPLLFTTKNIHIHVPEGAVPKDGPSAGITMMSCTNDSGKSIVRFISFKKWLKLRVYIVIAAGLTRNFNLLPYMFRRGRS